MVKAPKDVNAPKRPMNAYMAFSVKNRARVAKSLPAGHTFADVAAKMKQEWNKVSEAKKQSLDKAYKLDLAKWQKKFAAYKLTAKYKEHQKLKQEYKDQAAKKQNKFKKDENAPKRPASAYFCFLADKREAVREESGLSHKEVLTKMGAMWGELTDAQKKPYEKEAEKKKAAYEKALAKYQKSAAFKQYQKEKLEHQDSLKAAKKAKSPKAKSARKAAKSPKSGKKKAKTAKRSAKKPRAPKKSARKSARKATKSKAKKTTASK